MQNTALDLYETLKTAYELYGRKEGLGISLVASTEYIDDKYRELVKKLLLEGKQPYEIFRKLQEIEQDLSQVSRASDGESEDDSELEDGDQEDADDEVTTGTLKPGTVKDYAERINASYPEISSALKEFVPVKWRYEGNGPYETTIPADSFNGEDLALEYFSPYFPDYLKMDMVIHGTLRVYKGKVWEKPIVYVFIDNSGSMSTDYKYRLATSILSYISLLDIDLQKSKYFLYTGQIEYRGSFEEDLVEPAFNGGTTNIFSVIESATLEESPDVIIIVTDGQDQVNYLPLKPTIVVHLKPEELHSSIRKAVEDINGHYITIS